MADYNVTAMIGKLQRSADVATEVVVTDESINAGITPIDAVDGQPLDDRVLEVTVPQSTIDSALPVSDAPMLEARAIHSAFRELAYLRADMREAHGMTQELAQEAIAIKPSFQNHRPVKHYTALPSQTYYKASLEEIDMDMKAEVLRFLNEVDMSAGRALELIAYNQMTNDQWTAKANALSGFAAKIDDLQKSLEGAGLQWDEELFTQSMQNDYPAGFFINPTNAPFVRAMHDRGDYFNTMLAAHLIGETGRSVVQNWIDDLAKLAGAAGEQVPSGGDQVPKTMPTVKLPNGKSVKIDDAESHLFDLSMDGHDEEGKEKKDPLSFREAITGFGSSALVAGIPDILTDMAQQLEAFTALQEGIKYLKDEVSAYGGDDTYLKRVMDAAKDLLEFIEGFGRGSLRGISSYIGSWDIYASRMIAYGMYLVEGANELVKAKAPAELTTGADLRNRWDEQVTDLRNTSAVILD